MSRKNSKYQNDFEAFFCRTLGYNIMADKHQYEFVQSIIKPTKEVQAVFSDSPGGTGKSSLALSAAYYLLMNGEVDNIIYVRNTVSVRENGFLPGTIEDKELAYMKPAIDIINRIGLKIGNQDLYADMMTQGTLQCTSTSFLRGVDYDGSAVLIIDEAQNLDLVELQTVLTRPHDSVKIIVIGSSLQNDNQKITKYGHDKSLLPFQVYIKHFMEYQDINVRTINLVQNYRGKFSNHADMIQKTLGKIIAGDDTLPKENTDTYGPDFNKVEYEQELPY